LLQIEAHLSTPPFHGGKDFLIPTSNQLYTAVAIWTQKKPAFAIAKAGGAIWKLVTACRIGG
jgi:hypothetical protein